MTPLKQPLFIFMDAFQRFKLKLISIPQIPQIDTDDCVYLFVKFVKIICVIRVLSQNQKNPDENITGILMVILYNFSYNFHLHVTG